MKLNSGFLTHSDGEEQLLVPTGSVSFSGLVRSNSTAGFIVECLAEETNEDEITAKMLAKYDAPEETVRRDIRRILEQLRGIGAINE